MDFDPEYMNCIYDEILKATQHAARDLKRPVLPKDVQPRLPYNRAEGSLRRDMAEMERRGLLVRYGGAGGRKGYRVPTFMEQLAWRSNGGIWPHGTEKLNMRY